MGFFDGYAAIAAEAFPDLRIKTNPNSANARPEGSRTIYFDARASGFRRYHFLKKGDKPASIRVSHQCWDSSAPSASVKLMLDGWAGHTATATGLLLGLLSGKQKRFQRAFSVALRIITGDDTYPMIDLILLEDPAGVDPSDASYRAAIVAAERFRNDAERLVRLVPGWEREHGMSAQGKFRK